METVPYNLRSRGRVAGGRFLRKRRAGDDPSAKPRRRHRITKQKPCIDSSDSEESEGSNSETEEDLYQYLRDHYPFPLMAMKHYNRKRKEGELVYKFTKRVPRDTALYFDKIGFLHLVHFEAKPLDNPNSLERKLFLARVHETPDFCSHVSDCHMYSGPVNQIVTLPVGCVKCRLKDANAFNSLSMKLSEDLRKNDRKLQIKAANKKYQAKGLDRPPPPPVPKFYGDDHDPKSDGPSSSIP